MSTAAESLPDRARAYVAAGISVVPIRLDGTKAAAVPWKAYQERLATENELEHWFGHSEPYGLALIGGEASGALEQLDFDHAAEQIFPAWCQLVEEQNPGLIARLSIARTPSGGYHVRYRCPDETIPGNTDLAIDPTGRGHERILIQTRGEGGYALAPGCPAECHETGRLYEHVSGPFIPPTLNPDEREVLWTCARSLTREVKEPPRLVGVGDLRPGDDFDRRGPDWSEILVPHGWRCVFGAPGSERRWRRPGKERGWSATTGRCRGQDGSDLLRVFSSSAAPFRDGMSYGKFRAFAELNHAGNLSEAADDLARQGYGHRGANSRNGHIETNGHSNGQLVPAQREPEVELCVPLPSTSNWPEPPAAPAFHGVLGEILAKIAPQTEADPVAILAQLLVMFGNAIGRWPFWRIEDDKHFGNLYCCLVGDSAMGRKGVSFGRALRVFDALGDDNWARERIYTGLSSGEGLIWAVRDPIYSVHHVKQRGRIVDTQRIQTDPGVSDKRCLFVETEFARTLQAMLRKGNTLSALLRQGWDSGNLASATKNTPARATGAHVSIIGHITRAELAHSLGAISAFNGFANRFLWIAARRSQLLPLGGCAVELGALACKVALAVERARSVAEVGLDPEAAVIFSEEVYPRLSRSVEGIVGSILARGPAQVRRLAMLYALLDFKSVVQLAHMRAAVALWDYCEASCRWIFQASATGEPEADEILAALKIGPLSRGQINRQVFHGKLQAVKLTRHLVSLRDQGLIEERKKLDSKNRTVTVFAATCSALARSARSSPSENGHNDLRQND